MSNFLQGPPKFSRGQPVGDRCSRGLDVILKCKVLLPPETEPQLFRTQPVINKAITIRTLFSIYRVYTKEWCGIHIMYIETAPYFCVYPVFHVTIF
jgi:hypothetical protein